MTCTSNTNRYSHDFSLQNEMNCEPTWTLSHIDISLSISFFSKNMDFCPVSRFFDINGQFCLLQTMAFLSLIHKFSVSFYDSSVSDTLSCLKPSISFGGSDGLFFSDISLSLKFSFPSGGFGDLSLSLRLPP